MTTDPVPGGYIDNQYLDDAIRATKRCKDIVSQIVDQRPGPPALMSMLFSLAVEMMKALDALQEMQRIRERRRHERNTEDVQALRESDC